MSSCRHMPRRWHRRPTRRLRPLLRPSARERAESELVHARDRRDRISELLRVRHDLASHQADEPGHRARQQDLVRGEAAASLRAYYEAVAGARAEYEQAERAVSAAARHLGVPTGDVELEVLRQQAKERHEAAAELAHAVELEAGLPARREALHRLESELSAADEELLKPSRNSTTIGSRSRR